tara:strand:+ start:196 stop:708 length:513 start_codon:yes stop_codon:yes gene_type:complete
MAQQTKRRFNVVLDIYNTASFTGNQFDATFQVDLKRLVHNPEDLAKPYKITFSYYMQTGTFANTLLVATSLYSLNIGLRRKNYIQNYNQPVTYAGNIQAELITAGTGFGASRMSARPEDNPPFYVDNLTNLTEVQLTTLVNSTGIILNPTNQTSYNNLTKYIVYLHFEEA